MADKCRNVPIFVHELHKQQHDAVALTASNVLESERAVELLGEIVRLHGQAYLAKSPSLCLGDKRLKQAAPQTLASGIA